MSDPTPNLHSALYEGWVRHRRREAVGHEFRYRLCLLLLDLDELEQVFAGRWLWSLERPNLASFRRADYLGPTELPLREAVRQRVEQALGHWPGGPVRVLTQLRFAGYVFNPVSFYYCYAPGGERLEAVVAEITNTPWGERHAYVLGREQAEDRGRCLRWRFDKSFHVSPFFGMDHRYTWLFSAPRGRLLVHMENERQGERVFDATLSLRRKALTPSALAWALLRYPFQSARVHLAIYWQALRLWLRGAPFFSHPRHDAPLRALPARSHDE